LTGFEWNFGQYSHEHRAISWMYGNGTCNADFFTDGTLCNCMHVHHAVYY
jgi:hypothetical protein